MDQNQDTISLADVLSILWKHKLIMILIPVVMAAAGYAVPEYFITPTYEADAKLVVTTGNWTKSTTLTYDQINVANQLANTCAVILKSDSVLDEIISDLDLGITTEKMSKMITVTPASQTPVLNVTVTYSNPKVAAEIANEISDKAEGALLSAINTGSVEVISKGRADDKPVAPNVKKYTIAGFAAGILLAGIITIILESMDNTFSDEDDVRKYLGYPVLGIIPEIKRN